MPKNMKDKRLQRTKTETDMSKIKRTSKVGKLKQQESILLWLAVVVPSEGLAQTQMIWDDQQCRVMFVLYTFGDQSDLGMISPFSALHFQTKILRENEKEKQQLICVGLLHYLGHIYFVPLVDMSDQ